MAEFEFKLARGIVGKILKGEGEFKGVRREIESMARSVAAAAGPGHEVDSAVGRNRFRASVRTVTVEAMVAEAHRRNLTRAFDAARR